MSIRFSNDGARLLRALCEEGEKEEKEDEEEEEEDDDDNDADEKD